LKSFKKYEIIPFVIEIFPGNISVITDNNSQNGNKKIIPLALEILPA